MVYGILHGLVFTPFEKCSRVKYASLIVQHWSYEFYDGCDLSQKTPKKQSLNNTFCDLNITTFKETSMYQNVGVQF